MVIFNYSEKQISAKIVYYGPGLGGKTTSLAYIHKVLDEKDRGEMLSLATDADRTLYFDYMPVSLGKINDILNIKLQLYTVPGQIRYNNTRKVVLSGADAIVFVADSQTERYDANIESYKNMKINLLANQINPDSIPLVIQYNKRDLPSLIEIEELESTINERKVPYYPSIATTGVGVIEAFQEIGTLLLKHMATQYKVKIQSLTEDVFNVKEVSSENTQRFEQLKKDDEKKEENIPVSFDLTGDDDFEFGEIEPEIDDPILASDDDDDDVSVFPPIDSSDDDIIEQPIEGEIGNMSTQNNDYKLMTKKIDKLIKDSTAIIKKQSEILEALLEIKKGI